MPDSHKLFKKKIVFNGLMTDTNCKGLTYQPGNV